MPDGNGVVGVWAGVSLPMLRANLYPGIIATKIQVQIAKTEFLPLCMILVLSTLVGAAVQLALSAAISPGGICLPQLAVGWNNHGVTPQEQKEPTPSVTNPFFLSEASLLHSRLQHQMLFHKMEHMNRTLSYLICLLFSVGI